MQFLLFPLLLAFAAHHDPVWADDLDRFLEACENGAKVVKYCSKII